ASPSAFRSWFLLWLFVFFVAILLLHLGSAVVDHAADRGSGHGDLAAPADAGAVAYLHPVGARVEGEAGQRGPLAAAAVAARDGPASQEVPLLVEDLDLTADDARGAGHLQRDGRALAGRRGVAQQHGRLLALVVEGDVEDAVPVQIHEADGLGVED